MCIYQSNTFSVKLVTRDEMNNLLMVGDRRTRQSCKHAEDFISVFNISTGKFAHNERMTGNLTFVQECNQFVVSCAEVLDPYRSIGKNHASSPGLLRLTGLRFLSVPPSAAKRRALSREINASSPKRTKEVFSSTPVSLAALRSRLSSMFSVVLICISMHALCMPVKNKNELT